MRTIDRPAIIGVTLDALSPGPVARFDRANSMRVALSSGSLASVDDTQMFAGANMAALRGDDGRWEIIGFAQAELVGFNTFRLSRLLRGQGGETDLADRTLPAGADFVFLDSAIVPLVAGLANLGAMPRWRVGPADRDYADSSFVECNALVTAKSLMPYAPVHVTAARSDAGVTFAFQRCGRNDSDAWEPVEIPLGEDIERYDVEILRDGNVLRVITTNTPSALYQARDEGTDFGAAQSVFALRITQVSATVGRGFPLETIVHVA